MDELIFRFLIGGTFVSAFAFVGDAVRPKSFAGLFVGCLCLSEPNDH
jgi:hypothetical protein